MPVHKMLLTIPSCFDTERLHVRAYQAGDGNWYYPMSLRNREHLRRYEGANPACHLKSAEEAEILVREFAATWVARSAFFMGAFLKNQAIFTAQIYIGVVNLDLPEFEVGYFADAAHEGQGYVSEAVRGALGFIFNALQAHRVRLQCDDTNDRSFRVAERCGLKREGHLREDKQNPDGSLTGTYIYGILRSEYEQENYSKTGG